MIYQFSPFYNENLILNISSNEAAQYGGQIYVTESNLTFQYKEKRFNFNCKKENVHYQTFDAKKEFIPVNLLGKIKLVPYRFSNNRWEKTTLPYPTWYNEAVQRNNSCDVKGLDIKDDDIVILCDVDEILDSRKAKKVFELVKEKKIVTGYLYFTWYFFNLFSQNWGGGRRIMDIECL